MIDDVQLIAWLDGELDPEAARAVAAAVVSDPELGARAEAHRRVADRLRNGFAAIGSEPLPRSLVETVAGGTREPARARRQGGLASRGPIALRGSSLPAWARMAAVAPLALAAGYLIRSSMDAAMVSDRGGRLVAAGRLAKALDTQLASASAGPGAPRVVLSFRDREGQVCRTWRAEQQAGVACHQGGTWTMVATAAATAQTGQYRVAGAGDPVLAAVVDEMLAQGPYDAAEEARLRARHWR